MPIIPDILVSKIQSSPHNPGVYIFKDSLGNVLYIGKAINLHRRLMYYTKDEKDLYEKTAQFLKQAQTVQWIEVKSDIESLLLEINLIRTLKPKYNIISKDDKRPLYVWISNDPIPRVRTARVEIPGTGDYIGPFPSGYRLGYLLKKLRRIFPYCSCSTKRKQPCMYVDLGLCPNPDSLQTPRKKAAYTRTINKLKLFLNGNIHKVIKQLEKEMDGYSKKLEFEKASAIKYQIEAIQMLLEQPVSIAQYFSDQSIQQHVSKAQWNALEKLVHISPITRIEGYDIANTSGTLPTASMVVFEGGFVSTSQYRKFKIRDIEGPNDPLMIYQALSRRLKHVEWKYPEILLIDGGKTQVKAAMKALAEFNLQIQIIGLAKKFEQLVIPVDNSIQVLRLPMDHMALTLLRSIRDEAHRFTTTFHKILREKDVFAK